jgi:hypothetical protein
VNEINKTLSEGKDWDYFLNKKFKKLYDGKLKVTYEGTLTTLLSVVDKSISNFLFYKTKDSCDCSDCSGLKYETFVFLGATEI